MCKKEFTLIVNEVLNDFYCKLVALRYFEDGICEVRYSNDLFENHFYVPYRFMNRARLRLRIMEEEDLLFSIDTELDLGF